MQCGVEVLQEELFGSGIGVKGQIQRGDPVALQKAPGRHAAGSLFQCKMPACACPACEQDDVAGGGGFGARTKGRRMARTTLSTKASCPSTVCLTSAARPSKLPRCSGFTSVVPLASRPSSSMSRSIWAAAFQRGGGGIALGFELGVLLLQQLVQPFLLFQKRRVQVGQGGAAACFGCRSAGAALNLPPGRTRRSSDFPNHRCMP